MDGSGGILVKIWDILSCSLNCRSQLSMNPWPNITNCHVCMEDGDGNGRKLGFG